jgi:hypothetical protein
LAIPGGRRAIWFPHEVAANGRNRSAAKEPIPLRSSLTFMEMEFWHCWDCPLVLRNFIGGPLLAAFLLGVARALARGRLLPFSQLLAVVAWFVLATCAAVACRIGIDWRWSRTDLDLVVSRAADLTLAGALLSSVVGSVLWMLKVWRRGFGTGVH